MPSTNELRPGLPPLPIRVAALPIDKRGFPVPWFVSWINGEPEFRAADGQKLTQAIQEHRCWVCGQEIEDWYFAFVVGPMCAVNRISAEPPSHRECAEFSAVACPFLTRPHMRRRENDMPEGVSEPGGTMLRRNPGVALLWITRTFSTVWDRRGGKPPLFKMGAAREVVCYAEGRVATVDEIRSSVESGLPALREIAEKQGPYAQRELDRQVVDASRLLRIA